MSIFWSRKIPAVVVVFAACLAGAREARAGLMIEDSLYYDLSSVTSSGSDSYSKYFENFFAGSTFGKGFFIGWNFNYVGRNNALSGTTSALTGYEMGPMVGYYLNKSETLSIAVGWNPLVKSSATTVSGSSESWSGWGYQAELAFAPQIGKSTWIGIKLIVDEVSFTSQTDSSNSTSTVSFSSSSVLPTVFVSWRFN